MFGPNDTFSSSLLAQTFYGSKTEATFLKMPPRLGGGGEVSRMTAFKLENQLRSKEEKTAGKERGKEEMKGAGDRR